MNAGRAKDRSSSSRDAQLPDKAVHVSDMHCLNFFEQIQQPFGIGGIVTISFELRDQRTLTR
jgi:hypothetical protein